MGDEETMRGNGDDSVADGDPVNGMPEDGVLHVYDIGEQIVLGFAGKDVPSNFNVAHYRECIVQLAEANDTKTIAFDLTGVRIVPSGMLGLWASLNAKGIAVEVYNPSEDVEDVLEVTKLNQLITIKQIDV